MKDMAGVEQAVAKGAAVRGGKRDEFSYGKEGGA